MNRPCKSPLPVEDVINYLCGDDLPAEELERIEDHYFGCESCARRIDSFRTLGEGVKDLTSEGALTANVTAALIEQAEASGLKIRTYRPTADADVKCTVAPEDDFVLLRIGVDIDPAEEVDFRIEMTELKSGQKQTQAQTDVPVDRNAGELVMMYSAASIRALPRCKYEIEARVRGPSGERRLGPYRLDHTPWEQLNQH